FPHTQTLPYGGYTNLTVKTAITPAAVLPELRRTVQALDQGLAITHPRTMEEVIGRNTQDARVQTLLLTVFAALALVLAAVGLLYGVSPFDALTFVGVAALLATVAAAAYIFPVRRATRIDPLLALRYE